MNAVLFLTARQRGMTRMKGQQLLCHLLHLLGMGGGASLF